MKIQHFIFSVGNNYFIDVQNEYYKYIIILLLATINNWLKVEYSVNLLPRSDISVISSEASFEVILAGEKTLTPCCPPWIVCLHDIYIRGLQAPLTQPPHPPPWATPSCSIRGPGAASSRRWRGSLHLYMLVVHQADAPPVTGASNWGGTWQTWQLGISWAFLSMK